MKRALLLLLLPGALVASGGHAAARPSVVAQVTATPTVTAEPTPELPPVVDPPIVEDPSEDYVDPPPEDYVDPPPSRKPRQRKRGRGLCPRVKRGEHCGPGNGRRSAGGGDKVSHAGWPAVTGVFFVVQVHGGKHRFKGTKFNDEILGYDGHDHLSGGKGKDIIWGGYKPVPDNPATQRDTLIGGPGKDFIYPSHGRNVVRAGSGNDRIYAHWGRGVIDCGPGDDWVGVNKFDLHFTMRNCERVVQW